MRHQAEESVILKLESNKINAWFKERPETEDR